MSRPKKNNDNNVIIGEVNDINEVNEINENTEINNTNDNIITELENTISASNIPLENTKNNINDIVIPDIVIPVVNKQVKEPIIVNEEIEPKAKQVFTISHKVRLIRKEADTSNWKKVNIEKTKIKDESVFKIGGSGSAEKNCFSFDEQDFYFPKILGNISCTSPNFLQSVKNFYANISIAIPNNETGRELEIGFRYDNLPSYFIKNGVVLEEKIPENEKYRYGMPINVGDYFVYRYALVYRYVANCIEDVYNTPNIKFCLIDSKKEAIAKRSLMEKRVEAYAILKNLMENDVKLNAVLSVLNGKFGLGLDILQMSKLEREEKADDLIKTHLEDFLQSVKDPDLEYKYKINMMVSIPEIYLTKIPNTETYYYDNDFILAEKTDVLISYLKKTPSEHLEKINVLNNQLKVYLNKIT